MDIFKCEPQALSIGQMERLKISGLDTSDASMWWLQEPSSKTWHLSVREDLYYKPKSMKTIPAYTLEDIIRKIKGHLFFNHFITEGPWAVSWKDEILETETCEFGMTPLEAAYNALNRMAKSTPNGIEMLNS